MFQLYKMSAGVSIVFYFVFLFFTLNSQGTNETNSGKLNASVELFDGSRIVGEILIKSIPINVELIGEMEIPIERVRYYRKLTPQTNSVIKTINSDLLTGTILIKEITIDSSIGKLKIPMDKIKQILVYRIVDVKDLLNGLICRWSAEGNTKDLIGGQDGELLFGAEYADGKVGKAFSFSQLRARVHIPDSDKFKIKSSFTIECWVYANKLVEGSGCIIMNRSDNRPGKDTFHIGTNGKDFNFYISSEDDYCIVSSPGKEKEWTHLAGVWDKEEKEIRFYINGEKVASKKTNLEPIWELEAIPDTGVGIGNHAGKFHVFPFDGRVDEVGIYNRALSDDEIRSIYEAGERGCHILPPGVIPE